MLQRLSPHPKSLPRASLQVDATAERIGADRLRLVYEIAGQIGEVAAPSPGPADRTDELWRHTCLEAFVRAGEGPSYWEINLAPSRAWAVYRFDGYREGMSAPALPRPPQIDVPRSEERLRLEAVFDLGLPDPRASWRLALTAVIEETDGTVSYWSLAHPAGKPDFHHPDCLVLELPAPEGP
jgi:hypothetical protein